MLLTDLVAKLATAETPNMLNINEPMTAPMPMSESAKKVLIKLVNSSGVQVAVDINTAAPTSCEIVSKS